MKSKPQGLARTRTTYAVDGVRQNAITLTSCVGFCWDYTSMLQQSGYTKLSSHFDINM